MVACFAGQQKAAFDVESSWAENVTTFTYGMPLAAPVEISGISQDMLDPSRVTANRLAYSKGVLGPWNINYTTTHNLTGHGSTCAGAVSATALARLIGHVWGGRDTTLAAGTTLTGGTATVPTITTASGYAAGGMLRLGALGDGDGDGQFYMYSTHAASALNLLFAMNGAPVNGAVVYSPELVYPADSGCSMTGMRHRFLTGDLQFAVHGVFPTTFGFTGLEPGGHPQISIGWRGSWAQPLSASPTATPDADEYNWQPPSAGGSFFLQDYGTTTRATYGVRNFSLSYSLGMSAVMGGMGVNQYQTITGATRTKDTCTLSVVLDGQGVDTTPQWWDSWLANTDQQGCYSLHSADGTAVGFGFRRLHWMGPRPSQTSTSDRNTIPLNFQCEIGATTTTDLTLSPVLLALA